MKLGDRGTTIPYTEHSLSATVTLFHDLSCRLNNMSPARIPVHNTELVLDDELSIVNPNPTFLEGPRLLQNLICGPECKGNALEYLSAEGARTQFTYSALHTQAERLARQIGRQLVSETDAGRQIVPLLIPQCPSLYISELAILKAGAAFCPFNLDVPEERLKFMLKDVDARVVLTTSEYREKFSGIPGISIIDVAGALNNENDEHDVSLR